VAGHLGFFNIAILGISKAFGIHRLYFLIKRQKIGLRQQTMANMQKFFYLLLGLASCDPAPALPAYLATHLPGDGTDIKIIQELLGHHDLKTTLRHTHVSKATLKKVQSPFDKLKLGPKCPGTQLPGPANGRFRPAIRKVRQAKAPSAHKKSPAIR
jgi:hypothetical protein